MPSWLSFNATTETFSGTAPLTAQNLSVKVTATDTSALSASETFSATVLGTPQVTTQTPSQTWQEGKPVSLTLAASTFTDPQAEKLSYSATQSNGQVLPNWLSFNPATETFTGTAPGSLQNLTIEVTATDTSGLTASETFSAAVTAPAVKPGITETTPTAPQTWTDGQNVDFVLPGKTFTDALGLKMTFAACQVGGPDVSSWLHFNTASAEFTGKVPANASGTAWLAVIASDAQHASAMDLFPVTFAAGAAHVGSASVCVGTMPDLDPSHLANMLVFHS